MKMKAIWTGAAAPLAGSGERQLAPKSLPLARDKKLPRTQF